jgi:hypothetical protein
MEATLRFIRTNPWLGITKFKNCADYIGSYWTRSGNRYTGLTEEDARRLEKAMGFSEGYLAPYSPYWTTYAIKLERKDLILHTENPEDELKYLFLKNHKRVAFGTANIKPSNDYVLLNSEAEAEENNKKYKVKREAYSAFTKMSLEEMRKCLRLYGFKSDSISNELVESKLNELIENDPQKYLLLWVNNNNKETQYLIEAAISKNVIRKNKNLYYYGTDVIGRSMDEAVLMLDDKKNQDIRLAIMQEIESK